MIETFLFCRSIDMENKKLNAKISIPVLYLESDYDIKGRALVVPIQGVGLFTANLSKYRVCLLKQLKLFDDDI